MTRETKAGIVVSCSFLSLVGVVLLTKLRDREGTAPGAEAAAQVHVAAEPLPAGKAATEKNPPANDQGLVPMQAAPLLQQPPTSSPIQQVKDETKTDARPLMSTPSQAGDKPVSVPTPHSPLPAGPSEGTAAMSAEKPGEKPAMSGQSLLPLPPPPAPAEKQRTEENPATEEKPANDRAAAMETQPTASKPVLPELAGPSTAPRGPDKPVASPTPVLPVLPTLPSATPEPERKSNTAEPPLAPTAPAPPKEETPSRPLPPLGAPASAVAPPMVAPMPPSLPRQSSTPAQVESYDEETYRLKPGDTFRSLSQSFFNTEKYEHALMVFNRNHPQAGDGARQDPPFLQPGQAVYIPPVRILDKYYGGAYTEPTPVATSAPIPPPPMVTPPIPAVGLDAPRSTMPSQPATPAERPAAPVTAGAGKNYRVAQGGELIMQVAKRTLDTVDRWAEIYKLNPRFNPSQPIPEGTLLQMPRDARIPVENAP